MNEQTTLIQSLYKGLKAYYDYTDQLETSIEKCGDIVADSVYDNMPDMSEDEFDHKDCRFLLSEVEDYLKEK